MGFIPLLSTDKHARIMEETNSDPVYSSYVRNPSLSRTVSFSRSLSRSAVFPQLPYFTTFTLWPFVPISCIC